ncbi:MAG: DUF2490 domain-containing protein [Flavobacteriaceae bacterium]
MLILVSVFSAHTQETEENTLGSWHLFSTTARISNHLSIQAATQIKYYRQLKNYNQFSLHGSINYHLKSNIMATLGYGFFVNDTTFESLSEENHRKDHKIEEIITIKTTTGKLKWEHRLKLEQRFIGNEDSYELLHRVRYRLQMLLPLSKIFYLSVNDELFFDLQEEFFGKNRIYGALGIHVAKHLNLQAGYFRTYADHSHLDRLKIAVFYNSDLRKKRDNMAYR